MGVGVKESCWKIRKKGKHVYNLCAKFVFVAGASSAIFLADAGTASANPEGGVVVGGSATITNTPAELQIHQTSDRALIEWSSFNIDAGETTRFYQPNSNSVALNRVVNSDQVSKINGNLIANGKVVIINPNGVLIGPNGNVDTAGFIATSADVDNDEFMKAGRKMNFSKAGRADAIVQNEGTITVGEEGLAALVAPNVRNDGLIQGNLSKVQLAGADTFAVDIYGDGLISFAVNSPADGSKRKLNVENKGTIIADGGAVIMTAAAASDVVTSSINNEGVIQAKSLVNRNGEIILTGDGADVKVKGKLDVSGTKSGGTIKIGGDYQGKGELAKAKTVSIDKDAELKASAGANGDGGKIIVWSEEETKALGKFYAKGGTESGNGGLVETSSKGLLDVGDAYVNTLAANGKAGYWLLDPATITIRTTGDPYTSLPPSGASIVNVNTINAALSNVVLVASTTVLFQTNVDIAAAGVGLYVSAGAASSTGVGVFSIFNGVNTLLTGGGGDIGLGNAYIRTNGGDVVLLSGNVINSNGATIYTNGGNISLTSGDINLANSNLATRGGNVNVTAIDVQSTEGSITTTGTRINTTNASSPSIGGITLMENGATLPTSGYGNAASVFLENANGGNISITGTNIGGNNVCFAAGGAGCVVADPNPPVGVTIDITITADAMNKIYGASDPLLTYIYSGSVNSGDVFSGALTRAAGENVGSYAISRGTLGITSSSGATYNITYIGNFFTINPYVLAVIANAQTKVYGSSDPTLSYSYGTLQNGDTNSIFTGSLSRTAGENVPDGPYAINQGSLNAGSNYTISFTENNLNITPYLLSVNAAAKTKIYGSADPALTYSYDALQNGDTSAVFSGNITRIAGENAGSYAISKGSLSAGSNYQISFTGNSLDITPYLLNVSASHQTKVYGSPDPLLTYTYGALQNGDSASIFTGNLARIAGENVNSYAINKGTLSAGNNYTISFTGNTLDITPYLLNVGANHQTKVYGDADPLLTYTYGTLQNGDTASVFTGSLTRTVGENVAGGPYAISKGSLSAGSNYTISYTGGNFSITPYVLAVNADAKTKVYGSPDQPLTYTYGALQNGDNASIFTGGLSRMAGENVNSYAINQGSLSAGGNYTIAYTGSFLDITPYLLSVSANAHGKIYGSADPTLTYTYAALQNGDADSVFTGSLGRTAGENIAGGPYAINQGSLSAGSNYAISFTGNSFTIDPYLLAVSANYQSKSYSTVDPTLTYTHAALQNGDTDSIFTGALTRSAGETMAGGPYAISQGNLSAGSNYTISFTGNFLDITPYLLTITANSQSKVYGSADPSLTYTYGALLNGDDASVFTGALSRAAGENTGSYAIGLGSLNAGPNYQIAFTGGFLDITPYLLAVTANAQTKVYGSADPTLTYTYAALQNRDDASIFTGTLSRTAGENVADGPYTINKGTLSAGSNYTISYTGNTLNITPYLLAVSANAQSKVYGSADALAYSYAALQNGDSASVFTGSLGRASGENVNSYAISQGSLSAGSNYNIAFTGNFLEITPYLLVVNADAKTKVYGSADPTLTYTYGTLQNGDTSAVFSGDLARAGGEDVNSYAINKGSLSAGSNYTIAYTGNFLDITPYLLTVNVNAQSKVYGSADPSLSYTYGALQNGDSSSVFTGNLARSAGENVNSYAINRGNLNAGDNYQISFTGNTLSITPYLLTVSANHQIKVYGSADPTLSYTYAALQNGDNASVFTGNLARSVGENVVGGPYAINRGNLSAGNNYTILFAGNTLEITPYLLAVNANAQSKIYGSADPALAYTYGSLQNGDNASIFTGSLLRAVGENVAGGPYAINQGSLNAGSNYTISYSGDFLTINPYTLSVVADGKAKVYGSGDPVLTYNYAALQNGDDASIFTGSLSRINGENVNSYAINQGSLSAGSNYIISYTAAAFNITPYLLSVTADAQTKQEGDIDPALTYTYGQLQNGDNDSVFAGLLERLPGETSGSYNITQGSLSAGGNYSISYNGNFLTVIAAPVSAPISALSAPRMYFEYLGRPSLSVAGQTINPDPAFQKYDTYVLDTDVSLAAANANQLQNLADLEPASGGNQKPQQKNQGVACVNSFLDGKACDTVSF